MMHERKEELNFMLSFFSFVNVEFWTNQLKMPII